MIKDCILRSQNLPHSSPKSFRACPPERWLGEQVPCTYVESLCPQPLGRSAPPGSSSQLLSRGLWGSTVPSSQASLGTKEKRNGSQHSSYLMALKYSLQRIKTCESSIHSRIGESLGRKPISLGADIPHLSRGRHFLMKVLSFYEGSQS